MWIYIIVSLLITLDVHFVSCNKGHDCDIFESSILFL